MDAGGDVGAYRIRPSAAVWAYAIRPYDFIHGHPRPSVPNYIRGHPRLNKQKRKEIAALGSKEAAGAAMTMRRV